MATTTFEWVAIERDYAAEKEGPIEFKDDIDHPLTEDKLKDVVLHVTSPAKETKEQTSAAKPSAPETPAFIDPLSASGSFDPLSASSVNDPLGAGQDSPVVTRAISTLSLDKKKNVIPTSTEYTTVAPESDLLNWSSKKAGVLQKYTTNESISIPSFVSGVSKVNVPVDKVKARLEQLEQFEDEEGGEMLQLTQKDYIKHIEKMHSDLITAWNTEQRVKALKISIKLAKLLGDTSEVIGFYPSKWVLITEILDTFGQLVYTRIKERATVFDGDTPIPLKDNFRAEDVADHAQETCKNWFFKIASIRELLPRLYVEMAIMKSYAYIYNDHYPKAIKAMMMLVRGIGDPLVATFARAYLSRRAHELVPTMKDSHALGLDDYIFLQKSFSEKKMIAMRENRGLTLPQYLGLFTPALDWMVQCLAWKADDGLFRQTMDKFKQDNNGAILNAIISAFEPRFISANAMAFVEHIKASDPTTFEKHELYRTLGVNLMLQPPTAISAQDAAAIFTAIWNDVTEIIDVNKYISVAEVFAEYPVKHINAKATNFLLSDILKHVTPDRKFADLQDHLQSIAQKIISSTKNFLELFTLDPFTPFLDLFRGNVQVEVNKSILTAFAKVDETISDPIMINTFFAIAKNVHDSINSLSFADEVRRIAKMVVAFIQKIDFGKDVEKQLNFYVEARRAFANLDAAKGTLVRNVCSLAMKTLQLVAGKHNKETSAFVRACIAFCYITIPSMDDPFVRLYLYILSGQVALLNQSLQQAESLFKAAITLIQEVPPTIESKKDHKIRSSEPELVEFVHNFIAILISVPGHPEFGPFYLLRGLQKVIQEYAWPEGTSSKADIYNSMIAMLSASSQRSLPYHFPKVEANDILYGGTQEFEQETNEYINELIALIMEEIKVLKKKHLETGMKTKKAKVSIDLLNRILTTAKLNKPLAELCYNLWDLAKKNKTNSMYLKNTVNYLRRLASGPRGRTTNLYEALLQKIIQGQQALLTQK